jgi:arsenate reductase (thioredoxin)
MAEGYLRAHYGHLFEAGSAGTEARGVHPAAIEVMREIGIDISRHRSKLIDEFYGSGADIVVTVCDNAREACPYFPGAKRIIHAGFPDPSSCRGTPAECLAQFRQARDAIIAWIETERAPQGVLTGKPESGSCPREIHVDHHGFTYRAVPSCYLERIRDK